MRWLAVCLFCGLLLGCRKQSAKSSPYSKRQKPRISSPSQLPDSPSRLPDSPTQKSPKQARTKPFKPTVITEKVVDSKGVMHISLAAIPSGTFLIGNSKKDGVQVRVNPQREVTLTNRIWMWQTEVTQKQFLFVMGYNPSHFKKCGGSCPVENVTWHQALYFANRLSRLQGLEQCFSCKEKKPQLVWSYDDKRDRHFQIPLKWNDVRCHVKKRFIGSAGRDYYKCKGWRLPTEAEWEHAARAGRILLVSILSLDKVFIRKLEKRLLREAWAVENTCDPCKGKEGPCGSYFHKGQRYTRYCGTNLVGMKQPNAWKLYDMLGNVSEWIFDRFPQYHVFKKKAINPIGPPKQEVRIWKGHKILLYNHRTMRGGDWFTPVRAALEKAVAPRRSQSHRGGFRLVRIRK